MSITKQYIKLVARFLPSPFMIAIILTAITFLMALIFTERDKSIFSQSLNIIGYWQTGFWELLSFTMQMVLILLLGHTLALTPFFSKIIEKIAKIPADTAQAALLVSFTTLSMSFLNWGLCLIFGAILARKVGDRFIEEGKSLNYGLIGAAGYSGMMAWHGGLSGSAPLKVAESNHFLVAKTGVIPIEATVFSASNLIVFGSLLLVVPLAFYIMGKFINSSNLKAREQEKTHQIKSKPHQEENSLDKAQWPAKVLGGFILFAAIISFIKSWQANEALVDLNFINFVLLGLGLLLHGSLAGFMNAVHSGIKGVSGIIIQFPLYAGIMGIMKYSGLVLFISDFFVSISNELTFPVLTFFSAGLVNFFVPSGGGQWAVQGPIVVEAANALGVSAPQIVMALAYGDQITNMLQPFWALPLLGITKLDAKDILPYSTIVLLIGSAIFVTALLLHY